MTAENTARQEQPKDKQGTETPVTPEVLEEAMHAMEHVDTPAPQGPSPEEELAQMKDQLLRTMAEMDNLRKRTQKELDDIRKYAVTQFARDLISVLENLDRAEASIPTELEEGVIKNIAEGIRLTHKELSSVFKRHGIEKISPLGEKFDHNFHQAIVEIPDANAEPGTVVQVMQNGFTIQGRLLRPALVGVAKAVDTNNAN